MTKTQRANQDRHNNLMRRFMLAVYYGDLKSQSELATLMTAKLRADAQKSLIKYTTNGDFTHLHSGHNELP